MTVPVSSTDEELSLLISQLTGESSLAPSSTKSTVVDENRDLKNWSASMSTAPSANASQPFAMNQAPNSMTRSSWSFQNPAPIYSQWQPVGLEGMESMFQSASAPFGQSPQYSRLMMPVSTMPQLMMATKHPVQLKQTMVKADDPNDFGFSDNFTDDSRFPLEKLPDQSPMRMMVDQSVPRPQGWDDWMSQSIPYQSSLSIASQPWRPATSFLEDLYSNTNYQTYENTLMNTAPVNPGLSWNTTQSVGMMPNYASSMMGPMAWRPV